jgi:hypothetical protein
MKLKTVSQQQPRSSAMAFDVKAQDLVQKWEIMTSELDSFEEKHRIYLKKLEEVEKLKKEHRMDLNKIQRKVDNITKLFDSHQLHIVVPNDERTIRTTDKLQLLRAGRENGKKSETPEERLVGLHEIRKNLITQRSDYLQRITYTLPQAPERYLSIILGSDLPVSILDKSDQWRYKESYERFKLRVTLVIMIMSLLLCTILPVNRALDAFFHFLLVWYYCTLTIRESVLVVNGSKIQF